MRIAYIAPYQGQEVVRRRPIVRNLSLAGRVKVERIAELLQRNSHSVEIFSQGEVIERGLKLYPGFSEQGRFHSAIPVRYASALPVRFVNAMWSSMQLVHLFESRHRVAAFDAVIIYNFKLPQVRCAKRAFYQMGLPVIVEYEDDVFVDLGGEKVGGVKARWQLAGVKEIFNIASAAIGISPQLLEQLPAFVPKLLLRGVVSDEIAEASKRPMDSRQNWVVFSGTLFRSKGLEQLIEAWKMLNLTDWELHIAGDGELNSRLRSIAANSRGIVFDGLLDRRQNALLLSSAKIGINAHDLSATPGNVFAFKIIEYLAAGTHVISTPMGSLGREMEKGMTYIPDNKPETIAESIKQVIRGRSYERIAAEAALAQYGPNAVARSLDELLNKATRPRRIDQHCDVGFPIPHRGRSASEVGN